MKFNSSMLNAVNEKGRAGRGRLAETGMGYMLSLRAQIILARAPVIMSLRSAALSRAILLYKI